MGKKSFPFFCFAPRPSFSLRRLGRGGARRERGAFARDAAQKKTREKERKGREILTALRFFNNEKVGEGRLDDASLFRLFPFRPLSTSFPKKEKNHNLPQLQARLITLSPLTLSLSLSVHKKLSVTLSVFHSSMCCKEKEGGRGQQREFSLFHRLVPASRAIKNITPRALTNKSLESTKGKQEEKAKKEERGA